MKHYLSWMLLVVSITIIVAGCRSKTENEQQVSQQAESLGARQTSTNNADSDNFPNAHGLPPLGWTGPVFKLSQDYPNKAPSPEQYPWSTINFKTDPERYIKAVLGYVYEGNIEVDWQLQKNPIRTWYHAPWMHWGSKGREFIHGLTRERTSKPYELSKKQTDSFRNYAVGFFNAPGGYITGRVWADHEKPDPSKSKFPIGTVTAKLLFTTATIDQVPFLENSFEWQANIQTSGSDERKPQNVRLLQLDIAVRDERANNTTGWVFGTFIYNNAASGRTPWDRMMPVGLMWGNDPGITPKMVKEGIKLKETWLNPEVNLAHYGWADRLNGPVDNPISSCLSCHATAQIPSSSPMTFGSTNKINVKLRWFRNIMAGKPFDRSSVSTDYSLQISTGILNLLESRQSKFRMLLNNRAFTKLDTETAKKIDDLSGERLVIDGKVYFPISRGED